MKFGIGANTSTAKGYFRVDTEHEFTSAENGFADTSEIDQRIVLMRQQFNMRDGAAEFFTLSDADGNPFSSYDNSTTSYYYLLVWQPREDRAYTYVAEPQDKAKYTAAEGTFYHYGNNVKTYSLDLVTINTTLYELINYPVPRDVFIKAPKGTDVRVYNKKLHYIPFNEYEPKSVNMISDENYDIFQFFLPVNKILHLEGSGGGYVRTASQFRLHDEAQNGLAITVNLEKDTDRREDYKDNPEYDDDLYLNIGDSRAINVGVDGTVDLFPLRVWQVMHGVTENYFIEPDYRFELLDAASGSVVSFDSAVAPKDVTVGGGAASVTPLGKRGREMYRVTGLAQGLALIRITYGPAAWADPDELGEPSHKESYTVSPNNSGYLYFNPIEDRNAVVIPVNVGGADNSGIDPGIGYSGEYDTVYIDSEAGYADYTFTPSSNVTSVRVHEPLHSVPLTKENWEADGRWSNGVKNDDGSYTVKLLDGRNIIELKAGGAVRYYVLYAKEITPVIKNENNPGWTRGNPVAPGDTLTVAWPGLKTPVQKLSGIYNPGYPYNVWTRYFAKYDGDGGEGTEVTSKRYSDVYGKEVGVQYTIKTENEIRFTPDRAGTVTLTSGQIHCMWLGKPLNSHRNIADSGVDIDMDSSEQTDRIWFSRLPDISFTVVDPNAPAPAASVDVGPQNGTLTSGAAGSVTFPLTAANVPDGNYDAVLTGAPAGVTVASGSVTITNGSGTVTLNATGAAAGSYTSVKLTLNGGGVNVTSEAFTLTIGSGNTGGNTDEETTIPVPGGSLTVSAPSESITVDPATGATILTNGGSVTTTTGEATVTVPPGATIATDGTITTAEGGVLALPGAGGASSSMEIYIPAGTTIDPHTGVATIHAPAQTGGGVAAVPVTLPGAGGKLDEEGNIPILVPDGATIDPHTGLITLRRDGRIILPGPNGKIDTGPTAEGAGDPDGGIANDDVTIDAPKETTVRPDTGVVTLPDGRAFNPDGSRVTTGGGDPIDPDDDLDDSDGGGGCVTGLLGTSAVVALAAAGLRRRRAR